MEDNVIWLAKNMIGCIQRMDDGFDLNCSSKSLFVWTVEKRRPLIKKYSSTARLDCDCPWIISFQSYLTTPLSNHDEHNKFK